MHRIGTKISVVHVVSVVYNWIKMNDAKTNALTNELTTRTGKVRYTLTFKGENIVLTGTRGAAYLSIINVKDGMHRFIDAPVAKLTIGALADGTLALGFEVAAERRAAATAA